jgi:hypothetical protein
MLSMEAIIYRALRNAIDRASLKGLGPMPPRMRVIKTLTSGYLTIDSTSPAGRLGAKFNVERGAEGDENFRRIRLQRTRQVDTPARLPHHGEHKNPGEMAGSRGRSVIKESLLDIKESSFPTPISVIAQ